MTNVTKRSIEDWIEGYLQYTEDQESPEKLHMWTAFSILSAILQRKVWLDRGTYLLYPNLYIIIVAESAKVRKSIAMEQGIRLLEEAVPNFPIYSGKTTAEGLIKHVLNRPVTYDNPADAKKPFIKYESQVLLYADELASFIGYDRNAASRMTMFLTETYSCKKLYKHTTKEGGILLVENNYPVLLAATDPRNLKVLPEETIGGFIGRTIFVTASKRRKKIAWPSIPSLDLRVRLVADLCRISDLSGELKITTAARNFFAEWYDNFTDKTTNDPRLDAFHERAHDTALKLASLISVSQGQSMVVEKEHVEAGVKIIELQANEFERIASWSMTSMYAQNRAKFIDVLRRAGGKLTRRMMMRSLGLSLEEIIGVEESLEAEGTILKTQAGNQMFYVLSPEEMAKGKAVE